VKFLFTGKLLLFLSNVIYYIYTKLDFTKSENCIPTLLIKKSCLETRVILIVLFIYTFPFLFPSSYLSHLTKDLKIKTCQNKLSCKEIAELMMGKCELSQRSYKNLKMILGQNNVKLPSYEEVREYCKKLETGTIEKIHPAELDCKCMGYQTSLHDTLQHIVSCPDLFHMFKFLSDTQQSKLFNFLKERDSNLYKNFNFSDRTLIIRDTGVSFV